MNSLEKFISRFHSKQKPENEFKSGTRENTKNDFLMEQTKQPGLITHNIIQSNVTVVGDAQETNAGIYKEKVKNLSKECTNSNVTEIFELENEHLDAEENKSDDHNKANVLVLERLFGSLLCHNKSNKIIDYEHNYAKNANENVDCNFAGYDKIELINAAPSADNKTSNENYGNDNVTKGLNAEMASKHRTVTSEYNQISVPFASIIVAQNINEQTQKCLKEFDDVLAELQSRMNAEINDAEAFSLDEIDDIVHGETEDDSSTYNFQQIKDIHFNDSKDILTVESILETFVTRLHGEIATRKEDSNNSSENIENNFDNIICEENKPTLVSKAFLDVSKEGNKTEAARNKRTDMDKTIECKKTKIKQLEENLRETQNIDTISISSDANSEDGCGYHHSLDFEFITENEAKLVGFIINFHPEKHNIKQYFNAKKEVPNSQEDLNKAGSSKNCSGYNSYPTHGKSIVPNKINSLETTKGSDIVQNEPHGLKPTENKDRPLSPKSLKDSGRPPNELDPLEMLAANCPESDLNNLNGLRPTDCIDGVQNGPHASGPSTYPTEGVQNEPVRSEAIYYQRTESDIRNDPYGPGPSRNVVHDIEEEHVDKSYIKNYEEPGEAQFVNMFHAEIPGLPTFEIHLLENKSVRTRGPMFVQYDGIGFDMNLAMQGAADSDDEYRDEAEETLKKIRGMYPAENTRRKRRRRH